LFVKLFIDYLVEVNSQKQKEEIDKLSLKNRCSGNADGENYFLSNVAIIILIILISQPAINQSS
jgi:hypothetical protein